MGINRIHGGGEYVEVAHNRMWNINTNGRADFIQLIYCAGSGYWIHNNYFNQYLPSRPQQTKFVLITTDATAPYGLFENNEVLNIRPALHASGFMAVRNNTFTYLSSGTDGYAIHSYMGDNCELYNNLFINQDIGTNRGVISNNLFLRENDTLVRLSLFNNSLYTNSFSVQGNLYPVDDVFADFSAENYRLKEQSPVSGMADDSLLRLVTIFSMDEGYIRDMDGKAISFDSLVDPGPYQSKEVPVAVQYQRKYNCITPHRYMVQKQFLHLDLPSGSVVGFDVISVTGRTVSSFSPEWFAMGTHEIALCRNGRIAHGIYTVVVYINAVASAGKIIVR